MSELPEDAGVPPTGDDPDGMGPSSAARLAIADVRQRVRNHLHRAELGSQRVESRIGRRFVSGTKG